jgi:endonuclease/exonuclease/phosphatase family metal-dependent hydrolase
MTKVKIATFNVENLLRRFNFYSYGRLKKEPPLELLGITDYEENMQLRKSLHVSLTDDSRQMTAQAIRETDADIVCMQEVDNKEVLDDFNDMYLKRAAGIHYGWRRVIEGNDRRGIDVGVMSIKRIDVTSHQHHTFDEFELYNDDLRDYGISPGDPIFRRDCLEVKYKVDDEKYLYLFVCHLKSMSGGRDKTKCVREAETKAVRRIIEDKFPNPDTEDWLILGDMNDYTHVKGVANNTHSLGEFSRGGFAQDLVGFMAKEDRWTHYWSSENQQRQLDYIWASPAIIAKNTNPKPKVKIIRGGMPHRVPDLEKVVRFPRVGFDRPKASDHCPVVAEFKV